MSTLKRIFVCCLLITFLFMTFTSPLTVSASTTFVEVATSYGDVATVAPYLIPFILILIAADWYYSNIDEIIDKATELYNTCSTSVRRWAHAAAEDYMEGRTTVAHVASHVDELNSLLGTNYGVDDDTEYLFFPSDLLNIDLLTSDNILASELTTTLLQGNSILKFISTSVNNIVSYLVQFPATLNSMLTNLKDSLKINLQSISEWVTYIHETMSLRLADLNKWIQTLNSNTVTKLDSIKDWVQTINVNLQGRFSEIKDYVSITIPNSINDVKVAVNGFLDTININMVTSFQSLETWVQNVNSSIKSRLDTVVETLTTSLPQSLSDIRTSVVDWLGDINSNLVTKLDSVVTWVQDLNSSIKSRLDTVVDTLTISLPQSISDFKTSVVDWFGDLNVNLVSELQFISQWVQDLNSSIKSRLNTVVDSLTISLPQSISDVKSSIVTWVGAVNSTLTQKLNNINTFVGSINSNLVDKFNSVIDSLNRSLPQYIESVAGACGQIFESLGTWFDSVTNSLYSVRDSIKTTISNFSDRIYYAVGSVESWLQAVNSNIVSKVDSVITWTQNINANLVNRLNLIKDTITGTVVNVITDVKSAVVSIPGQIEEFFDTIGEKIDSLITPVPPVTSPGVTDPLDQIDKSETEVLDSAKNGFEKAFEFMQNTADILAEHIEAFMALILVFTPFAEIPFFSGLLTVSVSIGVLAIVFAIALDSVKSYRSSSARSRKTAVKKGG